MVKLSEIKKYVSLKQKLVIFGVGRAGKIIEWVLNQFATPEQLCFCDNAVEKQNESIIPQVLAVEKAAKIKDSVYFVGFCGNVERKILSAVDCLHDRGVSDNDIILVDMSSEAIEVLYEKYLCDYIDKVLSVRKEREIISKVEKIKFMSADFTPQREEKGGGGPVGAICMQKKCLGDSYGDIEIEYPYYIMTEERNLGVNIRPYMTGTIDSVRKMVEEDKNTVYIVNDIFSAFALYIMGKNYSVIYHGQGDVVKEMTLWGTELDESVKSRIYLMEKLATENAYQVMFPSKGAEIYFRQSFNCKLNFEPFIPMYNTVTDFPKPEEVESVKREDDCITFLSVGQMTLLKGMDRIPSFIKEYALRTENKVRWIVVANGVLKEQINKEMSIVQSKYANVEYINIDYVVSHAQIFYLMMLCDVYIMLHRVSIFDFSTLEAMYSGKTVMLSNIPGNDEYNKENNICLIDEKINWEKVEYAIGHRDEWGKRNKDIYEKYFSKDVFLNNYHRMLEQLIIDVRVS